jgi:ankyrin repeat protein
MRVPSERVLVSREIVRLIQADAYPSINAMVKVPGDPNINDYVERLQFENEMDISFCRALTSLIPGYLLNTMGTNELITIAMLRGWIMSVSFLTTVWEHETDTDMWLESTLFWRNLYKENQYGNLIHNENIKYTDDNVLKQLHWMEKENHGCEYFNFSELLLYSLSNAWLKTAKWIVRNSQYLGDNFKPDGGASTPYIKTACVHTGGVTIEKQFYHGMTSCISNRELCVARKLNDSDIVSCSQYSLENHAIALWNLYEYVGFDPEDVGNERMLTSVIAYADSKSFSRLTKVLVDAWRKGDSSRLHENLLKDTRFMREAAQNNDSNLMKDLKRKGYAVNISGEEFSVLHEVVGRSTSGEDTLDLDIAFALIVVDCLHEMGADWCKRDKYGQMPLHVMASEGNPAMIRKVIQYKDFWQNDKKRCKDNNGRSPLHYIAFYGSNSEEDDEDVFEMIDIGMGFNIFAEDDFGYTPLHTLAKHGDWVRLRNAQLRHELKLQTIKGRSSNITLLEAAASGCQQRTTKFLLDEYNVPDNANLRGPQITALLNSKNKRGESLLYIACREGRRKTMCSYVQFLLDLGASVETTDFEGNNLMHAVAHNHTTRTGDSPGENDSCMPIIRNLFFRCPSMLTARNGNEHTALMEAIIAGESHVVSSFLLLARSVLHIHRCLQFVNDKDSLGRNLLVMVMGSVMRVNDMNLKKVDKYMRIAQQLIKAGTEVTDPAILLIRAARQKYEKTAAKESTEKAAQFAFKSGMRDMPPEVFHNIISHVFTQTELLHETAHDEDVDVGIEGGRWDLERNTENIDFDEEMQD